MDETDQNAADPTLARPSGPTSFEPVVDDPDHTPAYMPAPTSSERFDPGADFRYVRELGQGGMGIVHLMEQLSLRRLVAVKTVRSLDVASPLQRQRFLIEANAAARLQSRSPQRFGRWMVLQPRAAFCNVVRCRRVAFDALRTAP